MMDRDDKPGLTPIVGRAAPPQITGYFIESTALRSGSRGWLPAVAATITTEDGAGLTFTILADDADTLAAQLTTGADRSRLDVEALKAFGWNDPKTIDEMPGGDA